MAGDSRRVYGRRAGRRLRPGRQALLDELLPKLRLEPPTSGWLEPAQLFPRAADDLWVEIGFGGGEHLAWQAAHHPQIGFIGAEPFVNGVARLLGYVADRQLDNVRIVDDDVRPVLDALPDACVGRLFVLFPDPWPKRRHHRRRIVGPETLDGLARILKDGAELRAASDDAGHVAWMLRHVRGHADFEWTARRPGDWRRRPDDWPPTRYEAKAQAAGRPPTYLCFRRRPRG